MTNMSFNSGTVYRAKCFAVLDDVQRTLAFYLHSDLDSYVARSATTERCRDDVALDVCRVAKTSAGTNAIASPLDAPPACQHPCCSPPFA